MKGFIALVIFCSGATWFFVSLALSKSFGDAPTMLDYPLDTEIIDDRPVRVSRLHRDNTVKLI